MIDKKPFRVTNERLISDSRCVNNQNTKCSECDMNKNCSFDGYLAPDYILDLKDARELIDKQEALIKEMREEIIKYKNNTGVVYGGTEELLEKTKGFSK